MGGPTTWDWEVPTPDGTQWSTGPRREVCSFWEDSQGSEVERGGTKVSRPRTTDSRKIYFRQKWYPGVGFRSTEVDRLKVELGLNVDRGPPSVTSSTTWRLDL